MTVFRYRVFGLLISSDMALPVLAATAPTSGRAADVIVETLDPLPDSPSADFNAADSAHIKFNIKDVARYEVVAGERIIIRPVTGADPDAIGVYLLGPALGTLLHQRGLMPLHASATLLDDSAVAFSAPAGTGKSTLAAALMQRGHRIIADDVLALHQASDGRFLAYPGIPHIKLRPDVLEGLELGSSDEWPLNRVSQKHHVSNAISQQGKGYLLRRVYFLATGTRSDDVSIERLSAFDSLKSLRANICGDGLLSLLDQEARFLADAARLVRGVECYRLCRPRNLAAMPAVLDRLERHLDARSHRGE